MAVTKDILNQYISEKQEIEKLREKEHELEKKIKKIEEQICKIEKFHTKECENAVFDIEIQGFQIDDDYFDEWNECKIELELKNRMLFLIKKLLIESETQLILREKQVEGFIVLINDSITRRILRFRVLDGLTWQEVAKRIGENSTEASVRVAYSRFMGKK